MSSFPSISGPKRKLTGIRGAPPDMTMPPPGCRFHPRCSMCDPLETQTPPRLREVTPGHFVAWHVGMPLPEEIGG
jgi:peptide/nickel transport system ATP-binding protein